MAGRRGRHSVCRVSVYPRVLTPCRWSWIPGVITLRSATLTGSRWSNARTSGDEKGFADAPCVQIAEEKSPARFHESGLTEPTTRRLNRRLHQAKFRALRRRTPGIQGLAPLALQRHSASVNLVSC